MMVACAGARGRRGGDLHASVYKSESKARGEVRPQQLDLQDIVDSP